MSIVAILDKAKTLGVRLSIVGEVVKMKGPADAIATIKPEIAARKPEIMAHLRTTANDPAIIPPIPNDCIGALQSSDGGLYLPWGPYLDPESVDRMRGELIGLIETLADMEQWDTGRRDDVLTRAIRGPLADLLPNMAHFNERLTEARAEAQARAELDRRTWRYDR